MPFGCSDLSVLASSQTASHDCIDWIISEIKILGTFLLANCSMIAAVSGAPMGSHRRKWNFLYALSQPSTYHHRARTLQLSCGRKKRNRGKEKSGFLQQRRAFYELF
ncbi:uncharacterized protein V6R79_022531 [Siganus canaliculatus]